MSKKNWTRAVYIYIILYWFVFLRMVQTKYSTFIVIAVFIASILLTAIRPSEAKDSRILPKDKVELWFFLYLGIPLIKSLLFIIAKSITVMIP